MAGPSIPFDDRDGVIWYNGKLLPWRDAKTHVMTHSLHYGNAVFEGERIYNGKIFELTKHSERFRKSAQMVGYEIPYSVEELDAASNRCMKENKLETGYVRPLAWRGPEVIGVSGVGTKIHVMIAAFPWGKYYNNAAIPLITSRWKRPSPESIPHGSKCAGFYVIGTMSKDEALAAGATDALMLDYKGRVAEATGANIFLNIDGELHTPGTECILNGITRQTIIMLAEKRGLKVHVRDIYPEELKQASEIFLTGSAVEVTAVSSIDDLTYEVGPITKQMSEDYTALVNS